MILIQRIIRTQPSMRIVNIIIPQFTAIKYGHQYQLVVDYDDDRVAVSPFFLMLNAHSSPSSSMTHYVSFTDPPFHRNTIHTGLNTDLTNIFLLIVQCDEQRRQLDSIYYIKNKLIRHIIVDEIDIIYYW